MDSKNTSETTRPQPQPRKHTRLKIAVWLLAGLLVLLVLLVLAAPTVLSSTGVRALLLSRINRTVDGHVGVDNLSVGWFSGIKLTNLSFESPDGATQVKVGHIETQPRYASLLGGRVDLGKTVIDSPYLYLKLPVESARHPDKTGQTEPAPSQKTAIVLPVHSIDLEVHDGQAVIEVLDTNARPQRVTFKNIASNVLLNDTGQPSRLAVSLDVANGQPAGSVKAEAEVTPPKKGWTLEDTDGTFNVTISQLNLETLAPLLALAGVDAQTGGLLNVQANVHIQKGTVETVTAEATIEHFSQGVGQTKVVFDEPVRLIAKGGMKEQTLHIDELNLHAPFCSVTASGDAETLDYSIKADLAQTQTFIQQFTDMGEYSMAGQFNLSGKVNLSERTVASAGTGTVKALLLGKADTIAPPTDAALNYDLSLDTAQQQLRIVSAAVTAAPGTIRLMDATIPLGHAELPPIAMTAQADLDMAKAWPYAQILAEAPADIALAGLLSVTVSVQTQEDTLHIKTDKTGIRNLRVAKEGTEPFVQEQVTLQADMTLNMARRSIGINAFDMQSATGETLIKIIKGSIEQTTDEQTNKMDAEIEAEYDLQAISSFAAPFLPQGLSVQGKRKDRFVLSSQWPQNDPEQKIANLNGSGRLGFSQAYFMGLTFGPTDIAVTINQGKASIDMPDTTVNNGKVRFAADVDLSQEPMMLTLRKPAQVVENVRIDDVIAAELLQYLNPVFARAVGVSGVANLSCSEMAIPLGGAKPEDIVVDGKVGLTEVRLNSPLLRVFKTALRTEGLDLFSIPATPFTLREGEVRYSDMPMTFGRNFALHFSGIIGLDKRLQMEIKVPVDKKTIVVPLTGTLDEPTIDLADLLRPNLLEQIPIEDEKTKEAIKQGLDVLEGIFKR